MTDTDKPAATLDDILDVAKKRKAKSDGLSDDDLAVAFVNHYVIELCYVSFWDKWFGWDGTRWERERTLASYDRARKICRAPAPTKGKTQ
jgi:phage/plasmid-associated DNA primase